MITHFVSCHYNWGGKAPHAGFKNGSKYLAQNIPCLLQNIACAFRRKRNHRRKQRKEAFAFLGHVGRTFCAHKKIHSQRYQRVFKDNLELSDVHTQSEIGKSRHYLRKRNPKLADVSLPRLKKILPSSLQVCWQLHKWESRFGGTSSPCNQRRLPGQ